MQNIKKIKKELKVSSQAQEFKKIPYLSLSFEAAINCLKLNTSKLTKLQYLNSPLAKIKTRQEIKFPLELTTYGSLQNLTTELLTRKEKVSNVIKLKNTLLLKRKAFTMINCSDASIYFALNHTCLRSIKFTRLLKQYSA